MDVERFFVKPDNTVDIKCPHCRTTKTVPVEKIKDPTKRFLMSNACAEKFSRWCLNSERCIGRRPS